MWRGKLPATNVITPHHYRQEDSVLKQRIAACARSVADQRGSSWPTMRAHRRAKWNRHLKSSARKGSVLNLYMYICVYICIVIYNCISVYIYIYICIYVYIHKLLQFNMYNTAGLWTPQSRYSMPPRSIWVRWKPFKDCKICQLKHAQRTTHKSSPVHHTVERVSDRKRKTCRLGVATASTAPRANLSIVTKDQHAINRWKNVVCSRICHHQQKKNERKDCLGGYMMCSSCMGIYAYKNQEFGDVLFSKGCLTRLSRSQRRTRQYLGTGNCRQ